MRAEDHAQDAEWAHNQEHCRGHQVGEFGGFPFSLRGQRSREHRYEGRGERAFGEEVANQAGNSKGELESVVGGPCTEQARHHYFAHHPGDPAERHGRRDNAGGAEELMPVGGSGLHPYSTRRISTWL